MLVPAAAVGELSRPGLRMAGDPARRTARSTGCSSGSGSARPGSTRRARSLGRVRLPLAAVHDPADLRRARAGAALAARGVSAISARRSSTTFRRVVLPLVLPALVAGSIFTFSLTLGDYITPSLVSSNQFIGNVVFEQQGVAGQPAARGGVRPRPGRRSWRSTCSSPAGSARSRRCDGAWLAAARLIRRARVLAFLYLPLAIIVLYAFNAERDPGLADPAVHARSGSARRRDNPRSATRSALVLVQVGATEPIAIVLGLARGVRHPPLPVLRARDDLVRARAADRPAGHRHRASRCNASIRTAGIELRA